jgi:glycosyltransferase involved in cell wall biosynthesis
LVNEIQEIKKDLKLNHYPEVHLLTDFLSHEQMTQLHKKFHCFVLPHRSEGWGLPHMDAMSYGNPAIATNFSGNVDFMNEGNSYVVPYQLTPTFGMSWFVPWYDGTMYWAEPDLYNLAKTMRHVYENRDEAVSKGIAGRNYICENFNPTRSAQMLIEAVEKVI